MGDRAPRRQDHLVRKKDQIEATYREYAKILRLLLQRKFKDVSKLLTLHIEQSKSGVRKITLHRLHEGKVGIVIYKYLRLILDLA